MGMSQEGKHWSSARNNTLPQPAPDGDVVERVARAICREYTKMKTRDDDEIKWEVENAYDMWTGEAKAAIAAIQPAIDKARADAKAEERARCVEALNALLDEEGQYEVNTSNYHHDDVCALNAAYVAILENAVKAIEQGGGDASV